MHFLDDTTIWRGGYTSKYMTSETNSCSLDIDKEMLNLSFDIDSKGGGKTSIKVTIGKKDIGLIVDEIKKHMPEKLTNKQIENWVTQWFLIWKIQIAGNQF